MNLPQKYYLSLSIHKQIQIGVFSVSFCVCSLAFLLIVINTVLLLNLVYIDSMNILNTIENDSLDNIGMYVDTKLNYMIEDTKYGIQNLRNFIENNKRNSDFRDNLKFNHYTWAINVNAKNNTCNINTRLSCFVYKSLKTTGENVESEVLVNFLKIVTMSIPLMKKTMDHRFYNLYHKNIFNYIQLLSNNNSVVIYYPFGSFNKPVEYNSDIFTKSLTRISLDTAINYYNTTLRVSGDEIENLLNISLTIEKNPLPIFFSKYEAAPFVFPYASAYLTSPGIISTTSVKYNDDAGEALFSTLQDTKQINDVLMGDWSSSMIDDDAFYSIKAFKGVHVLVTKKSDGAQPLLTPSSCHYFIKYNELQNNYHNYTNNKFDMPFYLHNCFKDAQAKEKINRFFMNTMQIDNTTVSLPHYDFIKRKSKFRLFKDFYNPEDDSLGMYYKIVRYFVPDMKTRVVVNSIFFINYDINLYILKNSQYQKSSNHFMYLNNLLILIFIMFYILAFWYIIMTIIVIILIKTTGGISKPISDLILAVNSIQSEKDPENLRKQMQSINFPDDKDIDDLFQICKSLMTGGFTNSKAEMESSKKQFKKFQSKSTNISYIKCNNLILLDDALESWDSKSIFDYKNNNINKDVNQSYSLVNVSCDSICNNSLLFNKKQTKSIDSSRNNESLMTAEKIKIESICIHDSNDPYSNFYNFIMNEERKLSQKGALNNLFMKMTNTGNDLKIVKINFDDFN